MAENDRAFVTTTVTLTLHRAVLDEAVQWLKGGAAVMLVGQAGVGKTSIVQAMQQPALLAIDPFARISGRRAAVIRHALDAGRPCIGAARTLDRRTLGRAGRITWRFIPVHVPLVAPGALRRQVEAALAGLGTPDDHARHAVPEIVRAAQGRAAYAAWLVSGMTEYWRRHTDVPGAATLLVSLLEGGYTS